MANWTVLKEAIASVIKTNGNQEITGAVLQSTLNSIVNSIGENATFAGIATPITNPGTPDGPVFYFAAIAGSYSNFGGIEVLKGELAIFKWNNGTWIKETLELAAGSATEQEIIYDVSARNNNTAFESLKALLSSSNLSTLIPTSVRQGGITIRFIQSSDSKYVQYRYMESDATTIATFTNVKNWQGISTIPTLRSHDLVESDYFAYKLIEYEGFHLDVQLPAFVWTDVLIPKGIVSFKVKSDFANPKCDVYGSDKTTIIQKIELKGEGTFIFSGDVYYLRPYSTGEVEFYTKGLLGDINNKLEDASENLKNPTGEIVSKYTSVKALSSHAIIKNFSENKLDVSTETQRYKYDSNTGLIASGGTARRYEGKGINPNTKYVFTATTSTEIWGITQIVWLDYQGNQIPGSVYTLGTTVYTSPPNAYGVYVLANTPNTDRLIINEGEILKPYTPYTENIKINHDLLPSASSIDWSKYIYEAIGDSRTYGMNSNIRIEKRGTIGTGGDVTELPSDGAYPDAYEVITAGSYAIPGGSSTITAAVGDYIYFQGNTWHLCVGSPAETTAIWKVETWNNNYPNVIKHYTNITLVNQSLYGASFCYRPYLGADPVNDKTMYKQAAAINPLTNIVTVFGGANDRIIGVDDPKLTTNGQKRENPDDTYDVETFMGAVRTTIKNIKIRAPYAEIIFLIEGGDVAYDGGKTRSDMIREVCEEFRVAVLDVRNGGQDYSQVYDWLPTRYQPRTDGLHESTYGHEMLGTLLAGEMKKYLW